MPDTHHMPGPWNVVEETISVPIPGTEPREYNPTKYYQIETEWEHGQLKRPVSVVSIWRGVDSHAEVAMTKEDARLIAAAPEMFSALEHVKKILVKVATQDNLDLYCFVEEVLEKARGETA